MKKLAYVAGLFALTCAPLLAALYEGLEVGMDKDQVLKTLRRSKQLEGPPTDALLSRTGLNGVFKTKQSIGGQTFSLRPRAMRPLLSMLCGRSVEPVRVRRLTITMPALTVAVAPPCTAITTQRPSSFSSDRFFGR